MFSEVRAGLAHGQVGPIGARLLNPPANLVVKRVRDNEAGSAVRDVFGWTSPSRPQRSPS